MLGALNPSGPHHFEMSFGSVHACHTASRDALITFSITMPFYHSFPLPPLKYFLS
jgi:hypothetical protein